MTQVAAPAEVGAPNRTPSTEQPRPRRVRSRWLVALLVAGALAAVAFWRINDDAAAPLNQGDVDRAVQAGIERSLQEQRQAPPDGTTAYGTIAPSLVTVRTDQAPADSDSPSSATPQSGAEDVGLGSGVVINAEGAILTALHVVEGAQRIQVEFADGTRAAAQIATSDADTDIAVLQVDALPQIVVPAVMAGAPQVGEPVFAVGNPLALERSLTAGVVSANNRSVRTQNGRTLSGLIQFDAAVNPGSSGGPLINRAGQVVGIVTALANPAKQAYFIGIGFAVPIATAGGAAGGPQQ